MIGPRFLSISKIWKTHLRRPVFIGIVTGINCNDGIYCPGIHKQRAEGDVFSVSAAIDELQLWGTRFRVCGRGYSVEWANRDSDGR